MAAKVSAIPPGMHTVTPHLVLRNTAEAIAFYVKAFGAEEVMRMAGPGGKGIMHAEIKIGDSMVFLADEWPGSGCTAPQSLNGTTVSLMLYVEDVDGRFKRAVEAGATPLMPPADMFWGDRYCKIADPFGHHWAMATHVEDVSPVEMERRAQEMFAQMAAAGPQG
jgi:PhnB protein